MAEMTRMVSAVPADQVMVIATGGEARTRLAYRDGQQTGETVQRDGGDVRRLSGVSVSVGGRGLDGATVETATPLDEVPAGTIYRADGTVELTVRAEGRSGFRGGDPRGVLIVSLYIERLTPVGNAADLLRAVPARKAASDAA